MIKDKFYVPKYYKAFKCKGMDCKNTCCKNWNITLTMSDYDKISSLDCSNELREKIDRGISIFNNATSERYAKIDLNYYGECKLRLENGYCGLQCELGEENIPSVCRYYPRAPRLFPDKTSTISLSCEWVVEHLLSDINPIEFEYQELTFYLDKEQEIKINLDNFKTLRNKSIEIISNRDIEFFDRINELAKLFNVSLNTSSDFNLKMIESLSEFYTHSYSICDYINLDNIIDYKEVFNKLNEKVPNYSIYLEKILINHIMYMTFPFVSYKEDLEYALNGLFYVTLFLNQLIYNTIDTFDKVEVISNYFRVAEHANMYDVIESMILRNKITSKNH